MCVQKRELMMWCFYQSQDRNEIRCLTVPLTLYQNQTSTLYDVSSNTDWIERYIERMLWHLNSVLHAHNIYQNQPRLSLVHGILFIGGPFSILWREGESEKKLYVLACVWVQARVNVLYVVDSLRRYDSAYVILWARGCVANNVYRMCHFPHPHPYICQNVAKKNSLSFKSKIAPIPAMSHEISFQAQKLFIES